MRLHRTWVFGVGMALLFAGISLNRPRFASIADRVAAVAHSARSAQTDYKVLLAIGEDGRPTYHRLLESPDREVRWGAALFLTKLRGLPEDSCCRHYLFRAADTDVAAMTLLRSLCETQTSDAHTEVSQVLACNPELSPLIAEFLMSNRRSEQDARFRAFLKRETSKDALRSLQRGLKLLRPCRRHEDLLLAVDKRLGEIQAAG